MDPLSCLLVDDGGLSLDDVTPWIAEGLARIDTVSGGRADSVDWGREAWGAEISANKVTVYSMYDETCSRTLPLDAFRRVLMAWEEFIRRIPDESERVTIQV